MLACFALLLAAALAETPDVPADALALARAGDGTSVAWAVLVDPGARPSRSTVHVQYIVGADALELVVNGVVRDLLFDPDGQVLYALDHRPGGKKDEGETFVESIDLRTRKSGQRLRVPVSARALEPWPERQAILVASEDDLRTLLLPELRSGPLFRVPGPNLALATMSGNRVLIGQAAALLLVDLDDRPEHDQMAVRAKVESPAPIVALSIERDASSGQARLSDGRVLRVGTDPLELREETTGWVARAPTAPPPPPPPEPERLPQAKPEPPPSTPTDAAIPIPTPIQPVPALLPPPPPTHEEAPVMPPERPSQAPPPRPPSAASPRADAGGMIEGEFKAVVAVVFFGPGSVVREAARVAPDLSGAFDLPALAPGRYRVQLDGGGGHVLSTEPMFVVLDITPGTAPPPLRFRVMKAW
jgi:hypothetical protein